MYAERYNPANMANERTKATDTTNESLTRGYAWGGPDHTLWVIEYSVHSSRTINTWF